MESLYAAGNSLHKTEANFWRLARLRLAPAIWESQTIVGPRWVLERYRIHAFPKKDDQESEAKRSTGD